MLLAAQIAAAALAAGCPSNVANNLRTPPPPDSQQLITVEAASTRTTYATARIWRRSGACWAAAGGPYPARVGANGLRVNRREGDGTTPIGTFPIGPTMYGNDANPGVRFPYVRLRCGDWWVEDSRSAAYNTFQGTPRLRALGRDRVQHEPGRPGPRLGDLPARADRRPDERLRQPPRPGSRARAPLAIAGGGAAVRRHDTRMLIGSAVLLRARAERAP